MAAASSSMVNMAPQKKKKDQTSSRQTPWFPLAYVHE
jgi:hypothetical protein